MRWWVIPNGVGRKAGGVGSLVAPPRRRRGGADVPPIFGRGGDWVRFRVHDGQYRLAKNTTVARTDAQNFPVRGSPRETAMEASDAEQKATTRIATVARSVGSVLISKTIFMTERGRSRSLERRG